MNYLVVGATSAVGKEIVSQLEQMGHTVLGTTRSKDQSDTGGFYYDALSQQTIDFGHTELDGLIYLPGTINLKPFSRLTEQDFMEDFKINLLGAVKIIQQALPNFRKLSVGSVVLVSTVAVSKGLPYHASVAAAKGALEGLGRSLAAELAPKVRVNVIAPSLTDTPLAAKLLATDQRRETAMDKHPLKRIGKPSDIAPLAVFLLTGTSDWITGQVIAVDGGLSTLSV